MLDNEVIFARHHWESRAGGKMLLYFGPHVNDSLDLKSVREFIRRRGAWGAFWNYGWDREDGPWYAYVCDTQGYDLDKISSKNSRKSIRRSLERCEGKAISADWLAENGYETYLNACSRYTNYKILSREEFKRETLALNDVPGALLRGIFVDGAPAAYGVAYDVGQGLRFREAFFDPEFSHAKPMYALYYLLAHECLNGKYTEIDAGWRPLVHDTNIEEFFRRMGWRQAPCRIGLYLNLRLRALMFFVRVFRKLLQRLLPAGLWMGLEALLAAQTVARQSRNGSFGDVQRPI